MVPLSPAAPILDALLRQGLGGLEVVEPLPVDRLYNYPADFDLGRMSGELAIHDPVAKRDGRAPVIGRIGLRFALLPEEPEALKLRRTKLLEQPNCAAICADERRLSTYKEAISRGSRVLMGA